uniref:START domain-containing protein n=1 Tax=Globisporangium ultimum (strain ATCC 200006 / CBS 805.95 / DAOM BR144) TaxID=431595 RepID=K3X115_GLOUD
MSASSSSSSPSTASPPLPPIPAVAAPTSVDVTEAAYLCARTNSGRSHTHELPPTTAGKKFPKIVLTPKEQAHYDRVVGRLLYRTVQEYSAFNGEMDRSQWTSVRKNHDMSIYRSLKGTGDPRVTLMLGVGKFDGYLEDVMDGMYSENTEELRKVLTFVNVKFITGSIMHVSERRTPVDRFNFAGIKWYTTKTPGGAVSYDRDVLVYERQGVTFDANGDEIGYHLIQSVDRPEWPANMFKNVIRSHMSTCYLYKRKGNRVETFFLGEIFARGSFPQRISDFAIAGKWIQVVNAVKCSLARKLSQLKENLQNRSSSSSITISDM